MKVFKMYAMNYSEWQKAMEGEYARERKVLVKAENAEDARKLAKKLAKYACYSVSEAEEVEVNEEFDRIWIEPIKRGIKRFGELG